MAVGENINYIPEEASTYKAKPFEDLPAPPTLETTIAPIRQPKEVRPRFNEKGEIALTPSGNASEQVFTLPFEELSEAEQRSTTKESTINHLQEALNNDEMTKEIVESLAQSLNEFQESANADIDALMLEDLSQPQSLETFRGSKEPSVADRARENILFLDSVIRELSQVSRKGHQKELTALIQSLVTLRDETALVLKSHAYRLEKRLPSADQQLGKLYETMSRGSRVRPEVQQQARNIMDNKKAEFASEEELKDIRNQPDVNAYYEKMKREVGIIQQTFETNNIRHPSNKKGEKGSPLSIETFYATLENDPMPHIEQLIEEHSEKYNPQSAQALKEALITLEQAVDTLQKMSPEKFEVFGPRAQKELQALREKVRASLEKTTGLTQIPQLIENVNAFLVANVPDRAEDKEQFEADIAQLIDLLNNAFIDKPNDGHKWPTLDSRTLANIVSLATAIEGKYAKKTAQDVLVQKVRIPKVIVQGLGIGKGIEEAAVNIDKRDAAAELFHNIASFAEEYKNSEQDVVNRFGSIIKKLELQPSYIEQAATT